MINTVRKTKITVLLRFFINGDNLYLAADSYALGRLKKRALLFQFIVSSALIYFSILFVVFIIPPALLVLYLYFAWIKVFRVLFQRDSLNYALRINFPKNIQGNAFDWDDTDMFLKSINPLIISSLEESLEKNNLLEPDLKTILEGIKDKIGQTSVNINTGGGNFFGNIISGINNAVNNQNISQK